MPRPNQIVVSNTTPIISLSLINKLDLLQNLYGEVWIPPAVENEIVAGGTRAGAKELQNADYICTVPLVDIRRADLLSDLDRGEAEAIALALEQNAERILIDERLGRRHAQRLGLSVTGVLGILLRAKTEGYIDLIEPLIEILLEGDIRFSKALVEHALKIAGEK